MFVFYHIAGFVASEISHKLNSTVGQALAVEVSH